ncbi:MAG: hypothetical protein JNM13_14795 [Hyphomicrobiaceae bacterium]|nr:hypothetical protein [Hyphomicrobiaceae bacterium]
MAASIHLFPAVRRVGIARRLAATVKDYGPDARERFLCPILAKQAAVVERYAPAWEARAFVADLRAAVDRELDRLDSERRGDLFGGAA